MAIHIPFNHKPSTTSVQTTTHTVTSGKYARILCNWFVEASVDFNTANTVYTGFQVTNGFDNGTLEIWAKAGDIITFNVTAASASATGQPHYFIKDYTVLNITLNGSTFASFRAYASFNDWDRSAINTYSFGGAGGMDMYIEEYDVIS